MPTYKDVHLVDLKNDTDTDDHREAIKAAGNREIVQIVQTTHWEQIA